MAARKHAPTHLTDRASAQSGTFARVLPPDERPSMNTSPRPLPAAARAVYALLERGGLDAAHALLYSRELRALQRAGLARVGPDGSYTAVRTQPVAPVPKQPVRTEVVGLRLTERERAVLELYGPAATVAREWIEERLRAEVAAADAGKKVAKKRKP